MADIHGSPGDAPQMPQAATSSGPAPVPYPGGRDQGPEPPVYGAPDLGALADAGFVYHGVTNLGTAEDPSAHDVNGNPGPSGLVTPYYPGPLSPISAMGDNDAGGRDDVSQTVEGAVANATGRWHEFQADTYAPGRVIGSAVVGLPGQQQVGSTIGDLMQFPPVGEDPGAGVGNTLPTLAFYDPPREYGGTSGAPAYGGNQGNEPPPGFQGEAQ